MDFKKLLKSQQSSIPQNLGDLFNQLDRKANYLDLRAVQEEALSDISRQLDQKDIILKSSTGSGKTLIGLVFAEMMRRKYPGQPVVYLVPTLQLASQTISTGSDIGVACELFKENSDLPFAALEGKNVLVCTYDKMFVAGNYFHKNGSKPSAIVLDDVHAGIDRVRQKYTTIITGDCCEQIKKIFAGISNDSDPAMWASINGGDSNAIFEVPFWIWSEKFKEVFDIVESIKTEKDILFTWGNISRHIEQCRLCLTATSAELSLPVIPVEENSAYSMVNHRLFMSATIKDGASLIRDLNCDPSALGRIVEPVKDRGAGERMILPISLIDPSLNKEDVARICSKLKDETNVVVLTSSNSQSDVWTSHGATDIHGSQIDSYVKKLKSTPQGNFFVVSQRFDGVDLPDDACRILVIDGIPSGDRLCDKIDYARHKYTAAVNMRIVSRLEQALGRAVRSSADFAAILLVGNDIGAFIGRRDVKDLLEPHTQAQIEMGKEITCEIKKDRNSVKSILDAIKTLLSRDEGWKEFHRTSVSQVDSGSRKSGDLTINEKTSLALRKSWVEIKSRNHVKAVGIIQDFLSKGELEENQTVELLHRIAATSYSFDRSKAMGVYQQAYAINSNLPRPSQMPDKKYSKATKQSYNLQKIIEQFSDPQGLISRILEVKSKLAYAGTPESVEAGLFELGELLGAGSSRPEKEINRGPDILWIFEDLIFCIEAKSLKKAAIFKKDAAQLLLSSRWCNEQEFSSDPIIPIFATDTKQYERLEDVSFNPKLMSEAAVMDLVETLIKVINGYSHEGWKNSDLARLGRLISEFKITGGDILRKLAKIS